MEHDNVVDFLFHLMKKLDKKEISHEEAFAQAKLAQQLISAVRFTTEAKLLDSGKKSEIKTLNEVTVTIK